MLAGGGVEEVLCEWHEDYVVVFEGGDRELRSVKHREASQNPWTVRQLATDGGLTHLFESWRRTGRTHRCVLQTSGGLNPRAGEARDLRIACATKEPDQLEPWIDRMMETIELDVPPTADDMRGFLLALYVEDGLPRRDDIRARNLVDLVEPYLQRKRVSANHAAAVYAAIVSEIEVASRNRGGTPLIDVLGNPERLSAGEGLDELLTSKRLTRSRLEPIVDQVIPLHGNLSPLPMRRGLRVASARFVGRDDELRVLDALARAADPRRIVVAGLRGIGKSELVEQFSTLIDEDFSVVWALRQETIRQDLRGLQLALGLAPDAYSSLDTSDQLKAVFERLDLTHRWIVVIDDLSPVEASDLLPAEVSDRGTVIATSPTVEWPPEWHVVEVGKLDPEPSRALLAAMADVPDSGELDDIAERLDGIPLALVQAGAVIGGGMPAATYRDLFDLRAAELLSQGTPSNHPQPVVAALQLAIASAEQRCEASPILLRVWSAFGGWPVPRDLTIAASAETPGLLERLRDPLALYSAMSSLEAFALAAVDGQLVELHTLVADLVWQMSEQSEQLETLDAALQMVDRPVDADPPVELPALGQLMMRLADTEISDLRHARLLWRVANALCAAGQFRLGRTVADRAIAMSASEGNPPLDRAVMLHTLSVCALKGDYNVALGARLIIEALSLVSGRSQQLEQDLADELLILRILHYRPGDFVEFERDLRALRAEVAAGHTERREALRVLLSSLGAAYNEVGKLIRAEKLLREALALGQELEGERSPNHGLMRNNLAFTYQSSGRAQEAIEQYREGLAAYDEAGLTSHFDRTRIMGNLSLLLADAGQADEARQLAREALAVRRDHGPEESYAVAMMLKCSGDVERVLENEDEAQRLMTEAVNIGRRAGGANGWIVEQWEADRVNGTVARGRARVPAGRGRR